MQDYFLPSTMNIKQCNLLFSLRSNMVPVKTNFRHSYADLTCPVCLEPTQLDTQVHQLHCKTLLDGENIVINNKVCHDDIFSDDIQKQSAVVTLFEKLSVKRRKLVKESWRKQTFLMSRISVTQVIQIVVFGIFCMIEFVFDWIKLLLLLFSLS